MNFLIDTLSWLLLLGGSFLGISGAIGLFRFPDFFSRVHAASLTDTLCALMILSGLALQAGWSLITVKLFFVLLFLWYSSPAASHALVKAAHYSGLKPLVSENDETEPLQSRDSKRSPKRQGDSSSPS